MTASTHTSLPALIRGTPWGCVTASVSAAREPDRFQIGVIPICLRCECKSALDAFQRLYSGCESTAHRTEAVEIDVVRSRTGRWRRRCFEIHADGVKLFTVLQTKAVLPHIEWAINTQIMRNLPKFLQVHASVLQVAGHGVIFPASPGSGKTMLALGLLARGWRYLSDEFALIHPQTHELHAYPKALCVKSGAFPVAKRLGLLRPPPTIYRKGSKGRVTFLDPRVVSPLGAKAISSPCPVRHIVFCRYAEGCRPSLRPIPRADAVMRLNKNSFNFLKFRSQGIATFADVVRSAQCYELESGDLDATCDLVESAVLGSRATE